MSSKKRSSDRRPLRAYRSLQRRLARIGFMVKGSIQLRWTVCGYARCRCHKGGRSRHGPYYWWTTKVRGKTITWVLSREEGKLYLAWARNRQRLEGIVEEMFRVSAKIAQARLGRPPPWFRRR